MFIIFLLLKVLMAGSTFILIHLDELMVKIKSLNDKGVSDFF